MMDENTVRFMISHIYVSSLFDSELDYTKQLLLSVTTFDCK